MRSLTSGRGHFCALDTASSTGIGTVPTRLVLLARLVHPRALVALFLAVQDLGSSYFGELGQAGSILRCQRAQSGTHDNDLAGIHGAMCQGRIPLSHESLGVALANLGFIRTIARSVDKCLIFRPARVVMMCLLSKAGNCGGGYGGYAKGL